MVPEIRIDRCNEAPIRPDREFVLYWMIAFRRATWNAALDRALEHARELNKPLVVLEPLDCTYRWASDRFHQFVIDGMRDNAARFAKTTAAYYPYLEPASHAGRGLLAALGSRACVVVTDDFPCFRLPGLVAAAAKRLDVRLEKVDSNGLFPLRAVDRVFSTAFSFRRHLSKHLEPHLQEQPKPDPFGGLRLRRLTSLPKEILGRWPAARFPVDLSALPIDHAVRAVPARGGTTAALQALDRFVDERLSGYDEDRNQPGKEATSGLSPYLHFGHVSAHEIHHRLIAKKGRSRDGFIDQLVTWRELGFNMTSKRPDYDRYESLPRWCRKTLDDHAKDPRTFTYTLEDFERSATHDPLWNAAQGQLVREGRIHNYLRMLWGKKILEWSESPRRALDILIELNNKYALDGRDPNSYSGIFWILGRYDRAWGPERPIFGKIRYMSSDNTARKVRVRDYVARHAESAAP